MPNLFLISDTHFGHAAFLKFVDDDGSLIRKFESIEILDQLMIDNWNKMVNKKDTVYHLGDVVINRKFLQIMSQLNGKKILIKGNHDIFKLADYTEHFHDIRAVHRLHKTFVLSHIPLHQDSLPDGLINMHGHIHHRKVMLDANTINPKYFNCCVEHHNYCPVPFEIAKKMALEQV